MTAILIVAGIVVYLVLGCIVAGLMVRYDWIDEDYYAPQTTLAICMWPAVSVSIAAISLLYYPIVFIDWLVRKVGGIK